jgi:hypothetical protein
VWGADGAAVAAVDADELDAEQAAVARGRIATADVPHRTRRRGRRPEGVSDAPDRPPPGLIVA